MPASFATAPDLRTLIANGIDPVVVFDGTTGLSATAGCPYPATPPTIAVSGSGDITGEYACFLRFVDTRGNVSRPTAFSNVISASGAGSVDYTGLETFVGGDPGARRQILRNTAGQANVYYVDIDTTDLSSLSLSSTLSDDILSAQESQLIQDEDGLTRYDRYYRPSSTFAVVCPYNNRVYAAGYVVYTELSASLTFGSKQVYSLRAFPAGLLDDSFNFGGSLFFAAPGSAERYTIDVAPFDADADEDTVGFLLKSPWAGATNAFSRYAVSSATELRNAVFYSEAGLPESWHPANAFTVPEDGDDITALYTLNSFLFVTKSRRTYRFSSESDPLRDGAVFQSVGRGCVNHRTAIVVGDMAYVMDAQGVYVFDGRQATPISAAISDLFRGTNVHGYRVNWKCSRYFHGVYCPAEQCIRFFVVLRGDYLPHHALCYSTEFGRWWIEEYAYAVGASCLAPPGRQSGTWQAGAQTVYLAGEGSRVWSLGESALDGVPNWNYTFDGTVLDATPCRITPVAATSEPVTNTILTVLTGRATGQTRKITNNDSGILTVDRALLPVPAAGDRFCIGAVPYRYLSHRLRFTESEQQDGHSVRIAFEPQTWGSVGVRRYIDHSDDPEKLAARVQPDDGDGVTGETGDSEVRIDLTNRSGYAVIRGDRHLERDTPGARTVRVELVGASGPTPHRFSSFDVRGVRG